MKIKKVQISGFRAFNKVEDSTFNFMLPGDKTANFVSIYAPNGFGKTSFYDAVEWGVTHQIQRFDRMNDFNKIRKENNGAILLNNDSKKGEVIVETSSELYKNQINTRKAYNQKNKADNSYFKEVILSQDLIDTFIKEEKADDRYNKFVELNPEIKSYNNALKNISILIDSVEGNIKNLRTKIDEKQDNQLTIDFEEENKKFEEINKAIEFLKSQLEELDLIEKDTFTQTKFEILEQKIKSRIISLEIEIKSIKFRIENIDLTYNGLPNSNNDNSCNGIVDYYNNRLKIIELEKSKSHFNEIITLITDKEIFETKETHLNNEINEELKINTSYLNVKEKFKTYHLINNEINERTKILDSYNNNKEQIEKIIKEHPQIILNHQNELISLEKEINSKQTNLKNIPSQIVKYNYSKKNIEKLTEEIASLNIEVFEKGKVIDEIKSEINKHVYFTDKIDADIEILLDYKEFKDQKNLINNIINIENKIVENLERIMLINEKISQHNELNNELKDFISKGLEIISKNNNSNCPLCNQQYDSYLTLSERITDNKLFGKILKESLEEKLSIEDQINILRNDIDTFKSPLKDSLKKVMQSFQTNRLKIENELNRIVELKETKTQELITSENEINQIILSFENQFDISKIETKIKNEIKDIEIKIQYFKDTIEANKLKLNEANNLLNSTLSNINLLKNDISKMRSNKEYSDVLNFYTIVLKSNEINETALNEVIEDSKLSISKIKAQIEENLAQLNNAKSKLLTNVISKEDCSKEVDKIDTSILIYDKITQNFEQIVKTDYDIDLKNINKDQADKKFEIIKKNEKIRLQLLSKVFENYTIIDKLKNDCLKVTEFEKIQKEIDKQLDEIKKLEFVNDDLKKEKSNLIVYLKETIDGFFYKELINKIYSKIDPHPDYSEIEFECNFEDKNPRLQIYTVKYNKGVREKSIPALYFSTAQINILSLSIFLARALKTKNPENGESVNCIFIDDPIQSMDSINILSFIDLFRSMISFLDKQIIVSTHEENFHLLLQKKIPKGIFDSKYIEFETFGKLKPEPTFN